MDTSTLVLLGVLLYLYLEVWTIRICLRYGGWVLAGVLALDHLFMLASTVVFPTYFVWKLWFLWTTVRLEPVRGILWVPRLSLSEYRPRWRRPGWKAFTLVGVGGFLAALAVSAYSEEAAGWVAALWLLALLGISAWWVGIWSWTTFRRWTAPKRTFREPSPWLRGPYTW
jgi:hypothetical protein